MGSRGLWRVLAAWGLFSSGQWMVMIALGVYAYERSGASGVGVVTVARLLPAMLAAPVNGVLLDRLNRARVVAVSCVLQTGAVAATAAVVLADLPLVAVVATLVLGGFAGAPVRPALQVILPALAKTPTELTRATAAWSAMDSVGFLVGAGLGGVLLAVTEPGLVLVVSACSALLTTGLVLGLPASRASTERDSDGADGGSEGLGAVVAGLRFVASTRQLHAPFALFVGLLLLEGATDVFLVALALDELAMGSGGPGVLYVMWGVGGLLGSAALLAVVRRAGYGRALLLGALAFGVPMAVSGAGGVAVAVLAMVPVGVGYSMVESAMMGVLPRLADDAVIGRVYAVCELLYAGVAALGALLAPLLVHAVGPRGSLAVVGAGYAALGLAAAYRCLQLDRGEQVANRVRELLHGVPFLGTLPLPKLERLVRSAQPLEAPAGAQLITAGESGEDFFVIDSGEVEIVEYARWQGPGEGFGEIALLLDVPRTATVRAATDATLWRVGRSSFLAAVGAEGDVRSAADGAVAEHLARPRVES